MLKVTVSVKNSGSVKRLAEQLTRAVEVGMQSGGMIMEEVVERTANHMARYPTGELESTIHYETLSEGLITKGRIVAGTDHAYEFNFGANMHFVPYEAADERIKAGLYDYAPVIPVYESKDKQQKGLPPKYFYFSPEMAKPRTPIGYLVSSAKHPFMREGYEKSVGALLQELANTIRETADRG